VPLVHDVELFGEPWEHVRLLSDTHRNSALLALLRRRAEGARVLEIGAGTGLWSCVAARMGARRVVAVEPSGLAGTLRMLVERNGLTDRVEVVDALIEDLDPEPMDLVFSELLNADPLAEGLLDSSRVGARWLDADGHLAPHRLQVLAQLVQYGDSRSEAQAARAQIEGIEASLGLDLAPLVQLVSAPGTDRLLGQEPTALGKPALLWDLDLADPELQTPEPVTLDLPRLEAPRPDRVPAGLGAVVWFRAELDEGVWMTNSPGRESHWGQLVCGWAQDLPRQGSIRVRAHVQDDGVVVEPVRG